RLLPRGRAATAGRGDEPAARPGGAAAAGAGQAGGLFRSGGPLHAGGARGATAGDGRRSRDGDLHLARCGGPVGRGAVGASGQGGFRGADPWRVCRGQRPAPPAGSPAGTRVFEQVVIPQQPGTMRLPVPRFSWFDPESRTYRTAETAPITLTVRAAPQGSGPQ